MTTPTLGSSSPPAKLRDLHHLLHPPGVGLLADEDDGEADAVEDEAPSVELQLEPSQHLEETVPCSNQRNKDLVEVFLLMILTCAVPWVLLTPVEDLAENSLGPETEERFVCFCNFSMDELCHEHKTGPEYFVFFPHMYNVDLDIGGRAC